MMARAQLQTSADSTMDGWSNRISNSFQGLNIGESANKLAKGFNSSVQATKERLGQVAPDEITELPQGMLYSHNCQYCHSFLSRVQGP
jgi:hypothetical protein